MSERPIYVLVDAVKAAVAQYDESNDHDWSHNGVTDHDCVRCRLLEAIGLDPSRTATRVRAISARNKDLAWQVWRNFNEVERRAFRGGELGGMSARSYIVKYYGEPFNASGTETAWSELVKLSDAWARGEEHAP